MKSFFILLFIIASLNLSATIKPIPSEEKEIVLQKLDLVNGYLMKKWPDPGQTVTTNRERSSNLWTRGTYFEGLMALHSIAPRDSYYNYAVKWGESHNWQFRNNKNPHEPQIYTTDANHLCAAQTYIDLFILDPQPERIKYTKMCIDSTMNKGVIEDWDWVDALQMAMPVYSRLAKIYNDNSYLDMMHEAFMHTKEELGGSGLYNPEDGLWWRDLDFVPPYKEPNGEDCYWSRGVGWAYATLVRVLNDMPKDYEHYNVYVDMFKEMSEALLKVQRTDGYWNVSLHDPNNYGGKELTGTLFFAYGMMWGINNNLLDSSYLTSAVKAWNVVTKECIRPNGSLAYIQGTGKEPKDGQPVTYDSKPDFEDYGIGIFLLAGTEYYKYLTNKQYSQAPKSKLTKRLEKIFYDDSFAKVNKREFSVSKYGAIGDGSTNNTNAIQKTIDMATENGGGIVTFQPGVYMISSIFVKSNVELRISEGVVLKAIQDDSLYPIIDTRIAGIEMLWPAALININNQENVRITGKGIIDGNGEYWWRKYWGNGLKDMGGMRKDYEEKDLRWIVDYDCQRVRAVVAYKSNNVLLKDFTVKRSGFWTVTMTYCNRAHVDGVIVRNNIGGYGPSSDGINTDSSTDVLVENCDVDCNDDNFCIKSGKDADGLRVNIPAKNVVYRNSIARKGHGLFTIGSETSGGMQNIEAYNLESFNTSIGIRFKSAKIRGGVIQDIYIHNIEMKGVGKPFQFEMNWYTSYSYPDLPDEYNENNIPEHWKTIIERVDPKKGIPEFKNISFSDINVTGADRAFYVNAYEEKKMKNFYWENISIQAKKAGSISNAENWKMKNVKVKAEDKVLYLTNSKKIEIPVGLTSEIK